MRRDPDVIRLRHGGDAAQFGDAAAMRDVGLQDVDRGAGAAGRGEEGLAVPAVVEPFAERDGRRGQDRELEDGFGVFGQEGLFDEERAVGFDEPGELFGHGFVQAAVEVEGDVEAEGLHGRESRYGRVEGRRRVQPVEVRGGVHFDGAEALG